MTLSNQIGSAPRAFQPESATPGRVAKGLRAAGATAGRVTRHLGKPNHAGPRGRTPKATPPSVKGAARRATRVAATKTVRVSTKPLSTITGPTKQPKLKNAPFASGALATNRLLRTSLGVPLGKR
jgi:hypothetical protein